MISIEECRRLIDGGEKLSDEQVIEIKDALYNLADLALEAYFDDVIEKWG